MALSNVTQLKEILDLIYNDSQSPDVYDSSLNGLRLYYNDMTKQATIFKMDDEDNEYILCIFNPQNLLFTDGGSVASYLGKVCKTASIQSNTTLGKGKGLGAYIDFKVLLRNMCAFLGVVMDNDFDDKNPQLYEDLKSIIKKYSSELDNNSPYYWAKVIEDNVDNYRSYIPVLMLVDVALYLKGIGVFSVNYNFLCSNKSIRYNTFLYSYAFDREFVKTNLLSLSDYYNLMSRDEFSDKVIEWAKYYAVFTNTNVNNVLSLVRGFLHEYSNQINFNNFLFFAVAGFSSSSDYLTLSVWEFTGDCTINNGVLITSSSNSDRSRYQFYPNSYPFDYTLYTVHYTPSTGVYDYNKNVVELASDDYLSLNNFIRFSNIKNDKYFTPFVDSGVFGSYYYIANVLGNLPNSSTVDTNLIKFNKLETLSTYDILVYSKLVDMDFSLGDKDLLIYTRNRTQVNSAYTGYLHVFKNIESISSSYLRELGNAGVPFYSAARYERTGHDLPDNTAYPVYNLSFFGVNLYNVSLNFGDNVNYEVYKIQYDPNVSVSISLDSSGSTDVFTFPKYGSDNPYLICTNICGVYDISDEKLESISLMNNAVYPTDVSDETSFRQLYDDCFYDVLQNPWFSDDELQNSLHPYTYVNCSVSKNPPATQEEAQDFDLDDLSDDEVADIIKDIDKASGDDDSADDDVPPNDNKVIGDEGDGPDLPLVDIIPSAAFGRILKIYALNLTQMSSFGDCFNTSDFWDRVSHFLADPTEAIVSLQACINFGFDDDMITEPADLVINGFLLKDTEDNPIQCTRLRTTVERGTCGEIDLTSKFGNYLDITNTSLSIYLPFVGIVDLNIADYIGGTLRLDYMVDHFTGNVVYALFCIRDGYTKPINTFDGVCQSEFPLKSDNFTRFAQLFGGM